MVTMLLDGQKWRRASAPQRAIVSLSIAAFATVVLICLAMLGPVVWTSIGADSPQETPSTPTQCSTIRSDTSRLACYDKVTGRKPSHPAKGANGPLHTV